MPHAFARHALIAAAGIVLATLPMSLPALAADGLPESWLLRGSNPSEYAVGVDPSITFGGKASAYIKSTGLNLDPQGFGTLMQKTSAAPFRGKTVRWTAYVKTENLQDWAGLWMRIDASDKTSIRFDNMQDRPILGSKDWTKYEITLDVPMASEYIAFGVLMGGRGAVHIAAVALDEVVTLPKPPVNLDFDAK